MPQARERQCRECCASFRDTRGMLSCPRCAAARQAARRAAGQGRPPARLRPGSAYCRGCPPSSPGNPGSEEKIEELARRAAAGLPLFGPHERSLRC